METTHVQHTLSHRNILKEIPPTNTHWTRATIQSFHRLSINYIYIISPLRSSREFEQQLRQTSPRVCSFWICARKRFVQNKVETCITPRWPFNWVYLNCCAVAAVNMSEKFAAQAQVFEKSFVNTTCYVIKTKKKKNCFYNIVYANAYTAAIYNKTRKQIIN